MTQRVLRIITRLNVGGPATHVILADRGLRARGWETLLLHGDVEPDEAEVDLRAVEFPCSGCVTWAGRSVPLPTPGLSGASWVRSIDTDRT